MLVENFIWDGWNTEHIAQHAVTCEEVEEACYSKPYIKKSKDGLYLIYGQTDNGRYLFIVIRHDHSLVYPITARTMTKYEQRLYYKGKR